LAQVGEKERVENEEEMIKSNSGQEKRNSGCLVPRTYLLGGRKVLEGDPGVESVKSKKLNRGKTTHGHRTAVAIGVSYPGGKGGPPKLEKPNISGKLKKEWSGKPDLSGPSPPTRNLQGVAQAKGEGGGTQPNYA